MSRSAPLLIRLARFVAGEAAPLARVRVLLSRERRPTASAVGGEGSASLAGSPTPTRRQRRWNVDPPIREIAEIKLTRCGASEQGEREGEPSPSPFCRGSAPFKLKEYKTPEEFAC